jgi:hypothetical protein
MSAKNIYYSDKYFDEKFEYRHVMLPKDLAKIDPKTHLMSESEWRKLGVQQSMVKNVPSISEKVFLHLKYIRNLRVNPLIYLEAANDSYALKDKVLLN